MPTGLESVEIIGCLAPQAGSWLHALALVGFVFATRAVCSERARVRSR
ncbi:MAG: hypothetical protein NXI30_17590 [bacterium]|nr:hypothetical protein [bacterium]